MTAFFTTRACPAWWMTATPKRVVGEWGVQGSLRWFVGEVEQRAHQRVPYLWVIERGSIMENPHGHLLLGSAPGLSPSWLKHRWGRAWDIDVAEYVEGGGAASYSFKQLERWWHDYDFGFGEEPPYRRVRSGRRGTPGWRKKARVPVGDGSAPGS